MPTFEDGPEFETSDSDETNGDDPPGANPAYSVSPRSNNQHFFGPEFAHPQFPLHDEPLFPHQTFRSAYSPLERPLRSPSYSPTLHRARVEDLSDYGSERPQPPFSPIRIRSPSRDADGFSLSLHSLAQAPSSPLNNGHFLGHHVSPLLLPPLELGPDARTAWFPRARHLHHHQRRETPTAAQSVRSAYPVSAQGYGLDRWSPSPPRSASASLPLNQSRTLTLPSGHSRRRSRESYISVAAGERLYIHVPRGLSVTIKVSRHRRRSSLH